VTLSLNEIKRRAIAFACEWREETREKAEAQTFWNEFFYVFGIERRRVASFEKPAIKFDGERGSIDLFWKGKLIVEHKSAGSDLEMAEHQALDYFAGLTDAELPKYVIVSDFKRFKIWDLDEDVSKEFALERLADNLHIFDFMSGHESVELKDLDPVNITAAELMGKLHDSLKRNGYVGHDLEVLLVRLMFCLFADHTLIFEKGKFASFITNRTGEDGTDTGPKLINLFEALNTPDGRRQHNLDEELKTFPYIDGALFEERMAIPSFDSETRANLLECCLFDWSSVSPAVFGSMFQSVMDPKERHNFGAHYTSEKNILKTVDALFMDELHKDFGEHKSNKKYLESMLSKIGQIKILDPACGCGNFLIISYRELRKLQIQIHKQIRKLEGKAGQQLLNVEFDRDLNVDAMHGIEIFEFPARIAQVGLWLADHQLNIELSKEMGFFYTRLPLKKSANIVMRNALRFDWQELVKKTELTYIIGNPPFISKQDRNAEQQEDIQIICKNIDNSGLLDYVSCWYVKASEFIQGTVVKVAFVSTNSITQGEQVGILAQHLQAEKGIKINFAHRTFRWNNEASGKAHVYVVIIGFSLADEPEKYLYDYTHPNAEPQRRKVKKINFYLVDWDDVYILGRSTPICPVPEISFGSMPNDGGNLLLDEREKNELLKEDPRMRKYIRPMVSAKQYLYGEPRYCIWLTDKDLPEVKKIPKLMERIKKVEEYRKQSKRETTRKLADRPYMFGEVRQPESVYILIPRTTSENRRYIPMAFLSKENIASDTCTFIPNASLFHFGVLMSAMHMAWVNHVCGRLESRYRYSNKLVYNNFPWPHSPKPAQIKNIERAVGEVLKVRDILGTTLAALYHPLLMPKKLLDAHKKLDAAVDRGYSDKKFNSDLERIRFLFALYADYSKNL